MKTLSRIALVATTAASMFFGGCPSPIEPVDNPPSVSSFTAQGNEEKKASTFRIQAADDNLLRRLVLEYGDGIVLDTTLNSQSVDLQKSHSYQTPDNYTAKATLTDNAGKTSSREAAVAVGVNPPPQFLTASLQGVEGSSKKTAVNSIVTDSEPVTIEEVSSLNAAVNASLVGDSIQVSLVDANANGTYSGAVRVKARDARGAVSQQDLNLNVAARDDVSGKVQDILKGQYIEGVKPALVMQGMLSGYVEIDGKKYSVASDGSYSSGKLVPGTHTLKAFITNGTDSSFVRTLQTSAGDKTLDVGVVTNAGTGFYLQLLRDFFHQANFFWSAGFPNLENKLKGIDFSKANQYTYWISQKDTVAFGENYNAFTLTEQDQLEQWLNNEILNYLPSNKRPSIYKATLNENLPVTPGPVSGTFIPVDYTILILKRMSGNPGTISTFDRDANGTFESALIGLFVPFEKAATLQEKLSALVAPNDVGGSGSYLQQALANKTCLHETQRTDYLTNPDIKLLWLPVVFPNGTQIDDVLKLPQ